MIKVSNCDDSREQDPISQAGYRGHKFRQHLSFERQLQRDIEKPMKFLSPRIDKIRQTFESTIRPPSVHSEMEFSQEDELNFTPITKPIV